MFIVSVGKGGYKNDVNSSYRQGRQDAFRDYVENFKFALGADSANNLENQRQVERARNNFSFLRDMDQLAQQRAFNFVKSSNDIDQAVFDANLNFAKNNQLDPQQLGHLDASITINDKGKKANDTYVAKEISQVSADNVDTQKQTEQIKFDKNKYENQNTQQLLTSLNALDEKIKSYDVDFDTFKNEKFDDARGIVLYKYLENEKLLAAQNKTTYNEDAAIAKALADPRFINATNELIQRQYSENQTALANLRDEKIALEDLLYKRGTVGGNTQKAPQQPKEDAVETIVPTDDKKEQFTNRYMTLKVNTGTNDRGEVLDGTRVIKEDGSYLEFKTLSAAKRYFGRLIKKQEFDPTDSPEFLGQ